MHPVTGFDQNPPPNLAHKSQYMKIDRFGAVFVANSVDQGATIRQERHAEGATGVWNKVRIATTEDKQLAVHRRGNENLDARDFIATGVSKKRLRNLREADDNGGYILPQVMHTARAILASADMADVHLMTDRDQVHLARLMASENYDLAERIYAQAENEEIQDAPKITSQLLMVALQNPTRTRVLMDLLDHPNLSAGVSEAIARLAVKDLPAAVSLADKAAREGADQAQGIQVAEGLARIFDHYPLAVPPLMEAYPGYVDELLQLADFSTRIALGQHPQQESADLIFELAVNLPTAACRLIHLLDHQEEPLLAQNFIHSLDELRHHEASTAVINRLAVIGSHNVGMGQCLLALVEIEQQNPGADPGLASRFARQVRQDIEQAGIITGNLGLPDDNQNNRELTNSYRNLLAREFGEEIAENVLAAHLQIPQEDNVLPLTYQLMQATIAAARELQHAAATLHHMEDPNENIAAYARVQAALKAYNLAAQSGSFPDAERAELYREEMLHMLQEIALATYTVDGTEDNSLLTSVAGQMASKEFDDKILEMLGTDWRITGRGRFSYGETVSNIVDSGGGTLEQIKTVTYPILGHLLQRAADNGMAFLNRTFNHLHQDLRRQGNPVGTRFFGGDDLTPGLTGLTITGSDPHKGGERVLILNFGPTDQEGDDRLLVYKPRDVRIDALLVGSRAFHGESTSLAEIVNAQLGNDAIPTYNFLEGPEGPDEYGYVEYLPHAGIEHFQMTPPEAETFYREYGRQAAMFMLMGARDLHQTNIYVSNRRPFFTDLELTVDPQCLDFITHPPLEGGQCDINQARQQSRALAQAMQLQGGLLNRGETVRTTKFTVNGTTDRLHETAGTRSEIAWESFVWIQGMHQQQHLDIDNAMPPSDDGLGSAQQFGANAFEQGFHEVINALAQDDIQHLITAYIDDLAGIHLRYHPSRRPYSLPHDRISSPTTSGTMLRLEINFWRDDWTPALTRWPLGGKPGQPVSMAFPTLTNWWLHVSAMRWCPTSVLET
ncbi:DUF4135 domain-containing protein [Verrucomicrobium spinosum]|uniref:DUF4135 domain-containing protein n=1 Tax=Verrucomicrobium spinosum TaxID=2736 RepID=UPI00094640E6|nr:DUF4135 domain-containing protein [Verrucomicrobium spinosum]